jgi:beta-lactamase regulating signal transducer with metallopeptidase domain
MNALWELPAWWLNFLLHTALLSAFTGGLCLLLRDPGRRAFAAAAGVLAIVVLPWISAHGWLPENSPPGAAALVEERPRSGWVIRIDTPATEDAVVMDAETADVVPGWASAGWRMALAGVWIAGGVAGLLVVAVRLVRLRRWSLTLREATNEERAFLESFASEKRNRFLISGSGTGPCAVGFFRMRMVVPEPLLEDGSRGKLRWVVRHEAEHIRGGDPRLAVLLSLAKCVVWWNPLVHLLALRWAEDRERVCDARALAAPDEGRSYGAFLLDLTESWTAPAGVPMAASGGAKRLAKRLRALVRGERVAARSVASAVLTLLCIAGGGLLASCAGVMTSRGETSAAAPRADTEYRVKLGTPEEAGPRQMPRIKITASFLQSDEPFPEAGSILSNIEQQLMMRRAAQKVGTNLMTAPSVLAKDGMATSVSIVRTEPRNKDIDDVRKVPFVGLSLESVPVIKGRQVSLSIDCLWNFEQRRSPLDLAASPDGNLPAPPRGFDWKTVRSASAKQTRMLSAGEYMVVALKGVPEGVHMIAMFKAEPIDADGNVVKDFGVRINGPHPIPSGGK